MSVLVHGINLAEPTPPGGGVSPSGGVSPTGGGVSPTGGGGGVSPSVFSPNPTLAIAANTCIDLGLFSAGGVDPLVSGFGAWVYDATNHLMIGQGGGHQSTNYDTIYAMQIGTELVFRGLYAPSGSDQWVQSNYSVGQGSWIFNKVTGVGPYPRPVARHTMDQSVSVNGIYINLSGVEGNAAPIAFPGANDALHSLTGGTAYQFDPVTTTFQFAAANNAAFAWAGCDYDPVTGKVWQMLGGIVPSISAYDPVTKTNSVVFDGAATYVIDQATGSPLSWYPVGINNAMVYFPPNGKLYYFTGGGHDDRNDPAVLAGLVAASYTPGLVYEIDPTVPSVTKVTGTSGVPMDPTGSLSGEQGAGLTLPGALWGTRGYCYDSHNQLILCGPMYGKMYAYNPITRAWSRQTMGGGLDPTLCGVWCMFDYDPVDNCVIFMGAPYLLSSQFVTRVYAYKWG